MKWVVVGAAAVLGALVCFPTDGPRSESRCDRSEEAVVVTGSSGGLGRAIKERLEAEGFKVIGASRSEGIDIRSGAAVLKLRELVKKANVVGLVNNAGVYTFPADAPFFGRDYVEELANGSVYAAYVADESVNVRAVVNVTGTLLPDLLAGAQKCGAATIINVGSINGLLSLRDTLPYGATKGAIEMWTDSLRRTLGHRNVRVTALQPGLIRTAMCPDHYCEPPEKTCVPAVLNALTAKNPRHRYTCAMRTGSSGVLFDWPELFWIQKHLPSWLTDRLLPTGMMLDVVDTA